MSSSEETGAQLIEDEMGWEARKSLRASLSPERKNRPLRPTGWRFFQESGF
jgi:hypothetical protein